MFDDEFFESIEKNKNTASKPKILIEPFFLEEVKKFDKIKFNSNNHWKEGKIPEDYHTIGEACRTHYWIDKFKNCYSVINIYGGDFLWMQDASMAGKHTGNFPSMYDEDLKNFVEKFKDNLGLFSGGKKYFVRTEDVSLKYGMCGVGPYNNLTDIIKSCCTCDRTHQAISKGMTSLKIYLCPWVDIIPGKEFRIFVCDNKINAISQQNLYEVNQFLKGFPKDQHNDILLGWANKIIEYFENVIKRNITHSKDYTIDFALLANDEPFFIEINPFGKEYPWGLGIGDWGLGIGDWGLGIGSCANTLIFYTNFPFPT